jgi:hypothetical protein
LPSALGRAELVPSRSRVLWTSWLAGLRRAHWPTWDLFGPVVPVFSALAVEPPVQSLSVGPYGENRPDFVSSLQPQVRRGRRLRLGNLVVLEL